MNLLQNKSYGLFYFKRGILLFWGIWFAIAFLSNLTDFFIATNIVQPLSFHSGNYSALEKVIRIYNMPFYFLNILFFLDILIQGISAILFLISALYFWYNKYFWQAINIAFIFSMSLWAVFLLMEEILIAYSFEAVHIRLFIFELISLLAIHLLPHQ